jgi:hypothetical protein
VILLPVWWYNFEQTRVDQIAQQLKLGSLEAGDTQDSPIKAENPDHRSPSPQRNSEVKSMLVLGYIITLLLIDL